MGKGKDTDNEIQEYNNKLRNLGITLGKIGQQGTNFIGRLEDSTSIPLDKKLTDTDKTILGHLNELAKLVPSDPYSAILLHNDSLFVVQKQLGRNLEPNAKSVVVANIKESQSYKDLKEPTIQYTAFAPNVAQHPDTIAITEFLNTNQDITIRSAYLGLASFDRGQLKGQKPASCSSCGAVVKALNDNGYNIKVSLYTPINFPSNENYQVPDFIKNNKVLRDSYLKHIETSLSKLESKLNIVDPIDMYVQLRTRDLNREFNAAIGKSLNQDTLNDLSSKLEKEKNTALLEYQSQPTSLMVMRFNNDLNLFRNDLRRAKELVVELRSPEAINKILEQKKNLLAKRLANIHKIGIPDNHNFESYKKSINQEFISYNEEKNKLEERIYNIKNRDAKLKNLSDQIERLQENKKVLEDKLEDLKNKLNQPRRSTPNSKSSKQKSNKSNRSQLGNKERLERLGLQRQEAQVKQDFTTNNQELENANGNYRKITGKDFDSKSHRAGDEIQQLRDQIKIIEDKLNNIGNKKQIYENIYKNDLRIKKIDDSLPVDKRNQELKNESSLTSLGQSRTDPVELSSSKGPPPSVSPSQIKPDKSTKKIIKQEKDKVTFNTDWYSAHDIVNNLQLNTDNVKVHIALNEASLATCVNYIKPIKDEEHFLIMNVHAINKTVSPGNSGND